MTTSLLFIGWFYTILSVLALGAGVFIIKALRRQGHRRLGLLDSLLFGVWVLGLAGGMGILLRSHWGLQALEYFCWALIVLMALSMAQRLGDLRRSARERYVNWIGALAGMLMVALPVFFLCYMTISALRSDATRTAFGL